MHGWNTPFQGNSPARAWSSTVSDGRTREQARALATVQKATRISITAG